MMNKISQLICSGVLLLGLEASILADSLTDRMKTRRPTIEKLKQEGLVGENNLGYLEFVSKTVKNKDIIDAQNADRKKGYEIVAKKQGAKTEQVAKVRAAYYAKKAKSGEWVQSRSGKWTKK